MACHITFDIVGFKCTWLMITPVDWFHFHCYLRLRGILTVERNALSVVLKIKIGRFFQKGDEKVEIEIESV